MTAKKAKPISVEERVRYLLSFLMILVHREGGELTIENLSDFAGLQATLSMRLDKEKDRVILKAVELTKGGTA